MVRLDETPYAPKKKVDLYANAQSVGRPYKEIAIISADDDGNELADSTLVAAMRKKAEALGADGLILGQQSQHTDGAAMIGPIMAMETVKTMKGAAIVYK